jgi:chemotaxis protein methyltransferase CheR
MATERDSHGELLRLAAWVEDAAGIHLPERKMALLRRRLGRRLRDLGLSSWHDYLGRVRADPAEQTRALDLVSTNETSFFREPRQFELLETVVLPRWKREADEGRRAPRLRAWCAACASGEEPYSLAIALLDQLGADARWEIDVLASDLSSRVLARAREAVFPAGRVEGRMPEARLRRYFLRGRNTRAGQLKVAPEVRELVRFQSINLIAGAYPVARGLDLILCRNVLIYFRPERRREVVERLLALLRPGGLLLLGHAENLAGLAAGARVLIPTVYERPPETGGPPGVAGARP